MNKPDAWMPLDIGDYLADTMHLTRDQHGGYVLLLMAYWRNGGPLDDDDELLAGIVKATAAEWRKLRAVLARFFRVEGGKWHQKRSDHEIEMAAKRREKASAAARARNPGSTQAPPEQRPSTGQADPEQAPRSPKPPPNAGSVSVSESPKHPSDAPGDGAPRPPDPPDQARGARLPDDWEPGEALIAWALAETPSIDWRAQTEQFRDYWKAQPGAKGRKADWAATWRGWMRRQVEFQGNPNGHAGNRTRQDQTALRRAGLASAIADIESAGGIAPD